MVRINLSVLFLIISLLINVKLLGQYPDDCTYHTIKTGEIPKMPDLGKSIIDNSVPDPVTITRITEYNKSWDWYPVHDYSKIQPWNADASLYKFTTMAVYDAKTYSLVRTIYGKDLYPTYWSNIDKDKMFSFREDGLIRTYYVSSNKIKTLGNITGYDVIKLGPGEGNIDKYDHYASFVGKRGKDLDILVYDLQEKKIVCKKSFPGGWNDGGWKPQFVDWVSVSQSGKYVGIMWDHNETSETNPFNGHYGVEVYNTTDMTFLRRIVKYGNHGDFGFTPSGEEVFVQFWGKTGSVNAYYLDRKEHFVMLYHDDFKHQGHISCRNFNRPGWAYISADIKDRGIVVAVKIDGSQTIEYFGHNYSSVSSYKNASMPVPSPNGDVVMFKSDFQASDDDREVYSFIVRKESVSGIGDVNKTSLVLFPNPAGDIVSIKGIGDPYGIFIYSINGTLLSYYRHKSTVDISNLTEGIYFVKVIDSGNNEVINKLIVKR